MNTYKVYLIKERKSETVVYVGYTGQTLHRRFNGHVIKKKLNPRDLYIELAGDDLTIHEALTLETMLIEQYRPRLNVSPGAIGKSRNLHSEAMKKKWSEERRGKPFAGVRTNRKGLSNSDEHNKKISEANSRPIICLNDGRIYQSQREAAKKLNLNESKVSLVVRGIRLHTKGYKFKYITL